MREPKYINLETAINALEMYGCETLTLAEKNLRSLPTITKAELLKQALDEQNVSENGTAFEKPLVP